MSILGNRVVYTRGESRGNIWAVDLAIGAQVQAAPLIASARGEGNPQYSPDGQRIAFQSNRSGGAEIWTCDREGAQCSQLTFLGVRASGYPRWSPDGKRIVFHSRPKGYANIFVVDANGGPVRQLTSGSSDDCCPGWSRDGKTIYFSSRRSGAEQVWKAPASGGKPAGNQ